MTRIGLIRAGMTGSGFAKNLLAARYPLIIHKRSPAMLSEKTHGFKDMRYTQELVLGVKT